MELFFFVFVFCFNLSLSPVFFLSWFLEDVAVVTGDQSTSASLQLLHEKLLSCPWPIEHETSLGPRHSGHRAQLSYLPGCTWLRLQAPSWGHRMKTSTTSSSSLWHHRDTTTSKITSPSCPASNPQKKSHQTKQSLTYMRQDGQLTSWVPWHWWKYSKSKRP